jgi:RNA polymerase II subunit A small phosphatase-like protein
MLIPPQTPDDKGKPTLVLDLDETLVHSSFGNVERPDVTLDIWLDGVMMTVKVLKRPGLEH